MPDLSEFNITTGDLWVVYFSQFMGNSAWLLQLTVTPLQIGLAQHITLQLLYTGNHGNVVKQLCNSYLFYYC